MGAWSSRRNIQWQGTRVAAGAALVLCLWWSLQFLAPSAIPSSLWLYQQQQTAAQSTLGLSSLSSHPDSSCFAWSAAAQQLLPQLQRRERQTQLEQRWGVAEPKTGGWGCQHRRGQPQHTALIPRILHHVYLPDMDTYLRVAGDKGEDIREEWGRSCRLMHADWDYVFWDLEAAQLLVEQHYPAFAQMFSSLDKVIKQADALRYFIMHAIGGVYLDLDLECFRPVDPWLEGNQVVLQTVGAGPTNGVLASTPGHPFWERVMQQVHDTWQNKPDIPVQSLTGPRVVAATFKQMVGERRGEPNTDPWVGEYIVNGTTITVHGAGSWYVPCKFMDSTCHRRLALQRAAGVAPLHQLAGYHRYATSWNQAGNANGIFSEEGVLGALCSE